MKKLLFLFAAVMVFAATTFGQCTPDPQYTESGLYPPAVAGPLYVPTGQPYSLVITIVVPTDTLYNGILVSIDSIGLNSLTGLPPGLTYATNSPNGYWDGGESGCCLFSGQVADADSGDYTLTLNCTGHSGIMVVPFPFDGYIMKCYPNAFVIESPQSTITELKNTPNPFVNSTQIEFSSLTNQDIAFTVYDINGKQVHQEFIKATTGINAITFESENLNAGIYSYSLTARGSAVSSRMLIID